MSCNCNPTKKKDLAYIQRMAEIYSKAIESDVQIYTFSQRGVGKKLYDFEKAGSQDRGAGFVEIIKFRPNKSKNVLSDSKRVKKPKRKPVIRKVDKDDESTGTGYTSEPTGEVDGDNGELLQGD